MTVLVDGNNLLHAASGVEQRTAEGGPVRPPGRQRLIELLDWWTRRRGGRVAVVFDGPAPRQGAVRRSGDRSIEVHFSGRATADDVILSLLQTAGNPRDVIVISQDNGLAKKARRRRAKVWSCAAFYAGLLTDIEISRQRPRVREPKEKEDGLTPDQTRQWMLEFGLDPAHEGPPAHP